MMSSTKTEIRLQVDYLNHDYRTYAYDVNDSLMSNYNDVKESIRQFNTAAKDTNSAVYKTFVSDSGSHIAEITKASIRRIETEVIYNG